MIVRPSVEQSPPPFPELDIPLDNSEVLASDPFAAPRQPQQIPATISAIPFIAGDDVYLRAGLSNLQAKFGVSQTAMNSLLAILETRTEFLSTRPEEERKRFLPVELTNSRKLQTACDGDLVDVKIRIHGTAPTGSRAWRKETLGRQRVSTVHRTSPSQWAVVDVYELIKHLHTSEWLSEIIAAGQEQESASVHVIRSVRDGSVYQSSPFFRQHPNAAALALYTDGLSLGDVKGASTLGLTTIALSVLNANPERMMREEELLVVGLCDNRVLKKYKFDRILQPILDDLIRLQNEGIAKVLCLTGDNPAVANAIGFKESASARVPCRHCFEPAATQRGMLVEPPPRNLSELRALSDPSCPEESRMNAGFNRLPPLATSLEEFDITVHCPPDLMHDELEGNVRLHTALLLGELRERKLVRLDDINSRIVSARGHKIVGRAIELREIPKPAWDKLSKGKHLRFTAAGHLAFALVLPLLLCDHDVWNDPKWELYLRHVSYVRFFCQEELSRAEVIQRSRDLMSMWSDFLQLYPEHWKNKQHYTIHLPTSVMRFGPPKGFWAMRFETVNKVVKSKVRHGNKINIAKVGLEAIHRQRALTKYGSVAGFQSTKRIRVITDQALIDFAAQALSVEAETVLPCRCHLTERTLVISADGRVHLALAFFRIANDATSSVHAVLHELTVVRSAHPFFHGRLFAAVARAASSPTAVVSVLDLTEARHYVCIARSDLSSEPRICETLHPHAQFVVFRYL